jgi:hypothetical protein
MDLLLQVSIAHSLVFKMWVFILNGIATSFVIHQVNSVSKHSVHIIPSATSSVSDRSPTKCYLLADCLSRNN